MRKKANITNIPVVVISTFGHCGIDWLHSLIDAHKEVLIIPSLSFFRKIDWLKRRKKINLNNKLEIKYILNNFLKILFKDTNINRSKKHLILKENQSRSIFKKYLNDFVNASDESELEKKFFLGIHYAYSKINKINLKKIKTIVSHEHVPWNCHNYEKYFDSKYIFMMRDPRASLSGCIKAYSWSKKIPIDYYMDHQLSFVVSAQNFYEKMKKKNKILLLKNENMHLNLEKEMKRLSKWLGIKFNKILLKSTLNGKKWIGESNYLAKGDLKKPYPKNYYKKNNVEKRWRNFLNKDQIFMIETLFSKIMIQNKYKFDNRINLVSKLKGYSSLFLSFHEFKNNFPYIKFNFPKSIIRRFCVIFLPQISRKIFDIA